VCRKNLHRRKRPRRYLHVLFLHSFLPTCCLLTLFPFLPFCRQLHFNYLLFGLRFGFRLGLRGCERKNALFDSGVDRVKDSLYDVGGVDGSEDPAEAGQPRREQRALVRVAANAREQVGVVGVRRLNQTRAKRGVVLGRRIKFKMERRVDILGVFGIHKSPDPPPQRDFFVHVQPHVQTER